MGCLIFSGMADGICCPDQRRLLHIEAVENVGPEVVGERDRSLGHEVGTLFN